MAASLETAALLAHQTQPHKPGFEENMARIFLQAAAGVALLTLSPFLLAIALAIRLESRGAALCLKERRGHSIFVFRTTTDVSGISVPTAFGSLLSKSGLDKLPLLVDVFLGNTRLDGH